MTGPNRTIDPTPRASVWLDDAPVDAGWPGPQDVDGPDATPGRNRRRLLAIGIPILAVVVLVGTVFAFGGFKERDDNITDIALGEKFTNGPYEFSFSSATIQQAPGYDKYKQVQKVVVTGTIRNNGDKANSPSGDWFLAEGVTQGAAMTAESAIVGDPNIFNRPEDVAPGLPPVRVDVEFDFPPTLKDSEIGFAMRELTFGTHSYLSTSGEQYWDASGRGLFRLRMHPTRIAAEKY